MISGVSKNIVGQLNLKSDQKSKQISKVQKNGNTLKDARHR